MRRRRHHGILIGLASCLVGPIAAQTWRLDTTFRTVIVDRSVNDILQLEDGTLIASGQMRFPDEPIPTLFHLGVRLNPDGSRNMDFVDYPAMGVRMKRWNDRFYVANGIGVRRCFLDGSVDNGFSMVNTAYLSPLQGADYHVYPDGRVLMSGAHQLSDTVRGFTGIHNLVWLTSTGHLDTTRTHRKANGTLRRFVQLPDSGFVVCGYGTVYDGHSVDKLIRVAADGTLDTTFRGHLTWGDAFDYVALPDGRVYMGGAHDPQRPTCGYGTSGPDPSQWGPGPHVQQLPGVLA